MRILYILNGLGFASNISLGGSDKRAMEIAKRLLRQGDKISILTTEAGKRLLQENLTVDYIVIDAPNFLRGNISNGLLGRVLAYLYLTLKGCSYLYKYKFDLVYPTSDFFFDLLPAISCKARGIAKKMVSIIHHVILHPFGRKGEAVKNVSLFLLQRLSFLLISLFADLILVYATEEGKKIIRVLKEYFRVKESRIKTALCGIDLDKLNRIGSAGKDFDACFVGGLRPAKGLHDLVPIWKKVCGINENSRLLVIGSGLQCYIEYIKNDIDRFEMSENIQLVERYLSENELYNQMARVKLLILPSYEEGWGIVVLEAMALGLPAIVYDLEVFKLFGEGVIRVEKGNLEKFATKIAELLKDEKFYGRIRDKALVISRQFDWEQAAGQEANILKGMISGN